MKNNKKMMIYPMLVLFLFALSGCSHSQKTALVNELHFPLEGVTTISIAYDEEPVTFIKSDTDELILKEYMTADKDSYHAKVTQSSDSIQISEGSKPVFHDDFSRSIEVYLPAAYCEHLSITTTNGNIDLTAIELSLTSLSVESTKGTIQIGTVSAADITLITTKGVLTLDTLDADQIQLTSTSGDVTCSSLTGNVTYQSTSGNLTVDSAFGSGSYRTENSGDLSVIYTQVDGDLYFYNKNDDVCVTLPEELECYLTLKTKNGSVSTPYQESKTINGQTTTITVGDHPTVTVNIETKNGAIKIEE